MLESDETHLPVGPNEWRDFAGDLWNSPTLSPSLTSTSVGDNLKLDDCPSAAGSLRLSPEQLVSPQTPADDSTQATLSLAHHNGASGRTQSTGMDLLHDYPRNSQGSPEELAHSAHHLPSDSLLRIDSGPQEGVPSYQKPVDNYVQNHAPVIVEGASVDPQSIQMRQALLTARSSAPQTSVQTSYNTPAGAFSTLGQSFVYTAGHHSVAYVPTTLTTMPPNGNALNEFTGGQVQASAQVALPIPQAPAQSHSGVVVNQPLNNATIYWPSKDTTFLRTSSSTTRPTVRPSLSNLMIPGPHYIPHRLRRTLNKSGGAGTHVPAQWPSPRSAFTVPSQASLVPSRPLAQGHDVPASCSTPRASFPAPVLAPSGPILPSIHTSTHPKRKHDDLPGASNPPSKRANLKASTGPEFASRASQLVQSGLSSSTNSRGTTGPSQVVANAPLIISAPVPVALSPTKTASPSILETLNIPDIPGRQWRESLVGTGSKYFTQEWSKPYLPDSTTTVGKYACQYICPVMGYGCWNLKSTQPIEWLYAAFKRKSKSFFPRHDAEFLRHLAYHRWREWMLSARRHDTVTKWEHEATRKSSRILRTQTPSPGVLARKKASHRRIA